MGVTDGHFWLPAIDRTVDRGSSCGDVCRRLVSSKLMNFLLSLVLAILLIPSLAIVI